MRHDDDDDVENAAYNFRMTKDSLADERAAAAGGWNRGNVKMVGNSASAKNQFLEMNTRWWVQKLS